MDNHYSYLLINFLVVLFPFLLSFDKKVHFYKKWRFIFPGLFITGILYLFWDYLFTINNVWSFNSNYIVGINFFGLPLEEILFFVTVPFSCVFIYECLISYFPLKIPSELVRILSITLVILSLVLLVIYHDRLYSLINFSTLSVILLFTLFKNTNLNMGKFYVAYIVSLLPFYIVNGLLTSVPIVMYNDLENMGFRVGTIPFEDHFYSMSLILMNILFFEFFRNRKLKNA